MILAGCAARVSAFHVTGRASVPEPSLMDQGPDT